jgi:PPM family protein phosphatase
LKRLGTPCPPFPNAGTLSSVDEGGGYQRRVRIMEMEKSTLTWQTFLTHAELSDVGLRRSNNQDNFGRVLASSEQQWHQRGHLFMVSDGMGAHAAGELASKMAVDTITLSYFKLPDRSPAEALRKAVEEANARIHARGQDNPDFKGMGTTTTALALLPQGALVAHVGDSRAYRLRGNRLEQLSFDHSLVWEMMAGGKLADKEVPGYIPKNIITRSLGPSEKVQVDLEGPFPLVEGDTFLLCSDGLSGPVADEEIGVIMGTLPPEEAVRVLVDLANLRGGPDNITVLIAHVNSLTPLAGAAAARRNGSSGGPPVNPIAWVALGVLGLATALLAFAQQPYAAVGAGLATLVTGAAIVLRKLSGTSGGGEPRLDGSKLGRGPHRSYVCPVDQAFVDKLAKIIEPLKLEATQQNWDVDWQRFNGFCQQAVTAASRQDYAGAIRAYSHAISAMTHELRNQSRKSAID